MLTAVTGINWGDEGKGRVIDLRRMQMLLSAIRAAITLVIQWLPNSRNLS